MKNVIVLLMNVKDVDITRRVLPPMIQASGWLLTSFEVRMKSLGESNLENKAPNNKVVLSNWVFEKKVISLNFTGPIYEVRIVEKEFTQVKRTDIHKVFLQVVKHFPIRVLRY